MGWEAGRVWGGRGIRGELQGSVAGLVVSGSGWWDVGG